ncbi:AMP-binding protein [Sphingosinicella sp. BN140058]|uniref:AMP-binding protein n=1 Tax=Sphingosinicella sp. BN140058 TaxID=1892855 RepID=UPI001010723A|nr:AMP-binding protein [Sphingosinicella sp. BN140058]QAY77814.1 fatty acyl-AMP ligase [Sphingosinicella sp. BN140058]
MRERTSLAAAIRTALAAEPERVRMRYLANGDDESAVLTCDEIDATARRVAAGLLAADLQHKRALLVVETGPDFLHAMLGCVYAEVIAIPASEPRPGASLDRLNEIAAASAAAVVLASARVAADLVRRIDPESPLARVPIVEVPALAAADPLAACPGEDRDPALPVLVQYTSGSTSTPRGVVLTSDCLLANIAMSSRGMDVGQSEAPEMLVNWMPHYHDMGLIGKILTPLVNALEVVHMPPLAFVQRPARWLKAISRYRATTSGAPAFALDLCTARVPDAVIDELDLSCWRTAFCGAEPVFASTLAAFRRRFARAGLRPDALFTCYGLAETTLYAAGAHPPAGAPEPDTAGLRAPCYLDDASRATLRIVDDAGRPVADGIEGAIWISGASVAAGYLDDAAGTAATFQARLSPDDGRPYLRTGDVGRIEGDRLTITGRSKDVLISGGANVAAVDVERFATRDLPHVNADGAAAFQKADLPGAPLVLVVERQRGAAPTMPDDETIATMRRAVFEALGIALDEVLIARPGTLPRTTSGKIRRAAVRDGWTPADAMTAAS